MRKKDFESLKENSFIEMFGFMSTSKNYEKATEFAGRSGYMFAIHIPNLTIPEEFDKYDHGFVDINENKLATSNFTDEEEVLFNALNVYKIKRIEPEDEKGFTLIHIEYGVIFQLLEKYRNQQRLTKD